MLLFKSTDNAAIVKAKAQLIMLGFTDPNLGSESIRSPTLTRRCRQLILQLCSHRSWPLLKTDAKTAFLQGKDPQPSKQMFGVPASELAEAMGLKRGQSSS